MAKTVSIENFSDVNAVEISSLAAKADAGSGALQLYSNQNILAYDFVVVGAPGDEKCEMAQVLLVADNASINLVSGLKYDHAIGEPITKVFADSARVYSSVNVNGRQPAFGAFTLCAGNPIKLDVDQQDTDFVDPSGGDTYWYCYTYYNSYTNTETPITDSQPMFAGAINYCSIQEVRQEAGMSNNKWISTSTFDQYRQEAQAEIDNALGNGLYGVPFALPVDPMITGIAKLLAAGKLLYGEHSASGGAMLQEAKDKLKSARDMIELIKARKYTLTDQQGQSLLLTNGSGTFAWPNRTTDSTPSYNGGSERQFRMDDVRNDYGRKY
jgi:hypothetical protein